MLLSLVIVAVEITSFTVACFFSRGSIVFLLQHKKITTKKTKNFGQRRGQNQSVAPPTFNCTWGGSRLPLPYSTISHQTQKWGSRGVCCFVKRRNQVFAQFVRPFSCGTAASKIRKVLFLEIVLVEKIITLFCMLTTTFLLPLSSLLSTRFSSILHSHLYLTRLPETPSSVVRKCP